MHPLVTLGIVALLALAAVPGCDMSFELKGCETEGCPAGYDCESEFIFSSCVRSCSHHTDCPAGENCDACFHQEPCDGHCRHGCRTSEECAGRACNYGMCALGQQCSTLEDCPEGEYCECGYTSPCAGYCAPGCGTSMDCPGSDVCVQGKCVSE